MKQRLYNGFFKLTKIKTLSKILSVMAYWCLYLRYKFQRRKCQKYISCMTYEEAYRKVDSVRKNIDNTSSNMVCNQTDTTIDLSIVIPVYNVEQYVQECIESVIRQRTEYKIEIIIVNDGATDGSDSIIREFKDDRIKYIIQENQGLSGARNTGLNAAVGKYVMFIDSDDVLCEDSLELMLGKAYAEDADIVIGSYYTFSNDRDKNYFINQSKTIIDNPKEAVRNMGFAWGKICRREMFNHLRFPSGAWYEDTIICNVLYRMSKRMVVLEEMVYGYRVNPNGISKTARNSEKTIDHLWVIYDAVKQARENGLPKDATEYQLVSGHLSNLMLHRLSKLDDEVLEAVFVLGCELLDNIRPEKYETEQSIINKDLDKAFQQRNYKLWKAASFIA